MPRVKYTAAKVALQDEIQRYEEQLAQAEWEVRTWLLSQTDTDCPHSDTFELRHTLQRLHEREQRPTRRTPSAPRVHERKVLHGGPWDLLDAGPQNFPTSSTKPSLPAT